MHSVVNSRQQYCFIIIISNERSELNVQPLKERIIMYHYRDANYYCNGNHYNI